MTKKLVARQVDSITHALFACDGKLVAYDPEGASPCQRVIPGCLDDGASALFNNTERINNGCDWAFSGDDAILSWNAHTECGGDQSSFEAHLYACLCIPDGRNLVVDIEGDRHYGIQDEEREDCWITHEVYVNGVQAAVVTHEMWNIDNCTLSFGFDSTGVYNEPGLYCIHIVSKSNGAWYNGGSFTYTLSIDVV